MEDIILDILAHLRARADTLAAPAAANAAGTDMAVGSSGVPTPPLDDIALGQLLQRHNKHRLDVREHYAKRKLLPYYLKVKSTDPQRWARWNIDPATETALLKLLQVKPRRTASGVATITVITKPHPCASDCLYCPNDLRMPKSYLHDEPACQRAERNYFDPYLQVTSRLRALTQMGHVCDKIELIILGGTWSDYPESYQIWFVTELFRALNESGQAGEQQDAEEQQTTAEQQPATDPTTTEQSARARRHLYQNFGLTNRPEELGERVHKIQHAVNEGVLTYNQAFDQLYGDSEAWQAAAAHQTADLNELETQQHRNEAAAHRVVGLVIETRPDTVNTASLTLLRQFGCTKVQVGIQSVDQHLLQLNERRISTDVIADAFALLRLFGFKIHAHFMVNLYGATSDSDKQDYLRFVTDARYQPDEVKLYPCSLVAGTRLGSHYKDGSWQPYTEEELLDVLVADTLATPPYARISRMIRDISAHDIVAGNKKTNLRQMVEHRIEQSGEEIREIRHREISTSEVALDDLTLETLSYETSVSHEYFLQWVTPESKIAGFLRLSLPELDYVGECGHHPDRHQSPLPIAPHEAMIREVHVYGAVSSLHRSTDQPTDATDTGTGMGTGTGAQHKGLGKQLIEEAARIARAHDYTKLNVISAVGTRHYYQRLGFKPTANGLYQQVFL